MRGVILAVVLLVASVVALPAAGFLTARNAPPVACGASASLALAQMSDTEATIARPSIDPTLSGREMVEAAAAIWFPAADVPVAVAIAGAESSFNPDPPNPPIVAGGTMRGLWQINDGAHPDLVNAPGRDWRNPVDNAWMAFQVWKRAGHSWTPWSTYNSGSYRRFLTDSDTSPTPQTQTRPAARSRLRRYRRDDRHLEQRCLEQHPPRRRRLLGPGANSRRHRRAGTRIRVTPKDDHEGRRWGVLDVSATAVQGSGLPDPQGHLGPHPRPQLEVRHRSAGPRQGDPSQSASRARLGRQLGRPEVRHLGDPARQDHRQPVLRGQHPPDRVGDQR